MRAPRLPSERAYTLASAALFPVLGLFVALPLAGAFMPLFRGDGAFDNLGRAFGDARFLGSFGFGLGQALASAVLALLVGLPGAYLLGRKKFPGKRLLSALAVVPFCVPPLIVALGFVLYYGKDGFLNRALMAIFSLDRPPLDFLYSFWGVVLAHGFYNFPLVMSMAGDAWSGIRRDTEDAARLLGAGRVRTFVTVTLPGILPAAGAAFTLTFLMCFFSFTIVLLFGGPGVGTPEVELYRAARFDLDRPLASAFALVESAVALLALYAYARLERRVSGRRTDAARREAAVPFRGPAGVAGAVVYGLLVLVAFLGPLAAVAGESLVVRSAKYGPGNLGLGNYLALFSSPSFVRAAGNTLALGLGSALLAALIGFALSLALKRTRSPFLASVLPLSPLALSSVVLAYGWSSVVGTATPLTLAAVQAVSAYPFILKGIQGALGSSDERLADAALALGSSRLGAVFRVRLPLAAPALLSGFAFAFAISAGDANALIAAPVPGYETLALKLYQLAGSYRFNEACAAATLLGLAVSLVFFLKDGRHAIA